MFNSKEEMIGCLFDSYDSKKPKEKILEILEQITFFYGGKKKLYLSTLSNFVEKEIDKLESVDDLPNFHFGKIQSRFSGNWMIFTELKDKALIDCGHILERKFKLKARKLLIHKIQALAKDHPLLKTDDLGDLPYDDIYARLSSHYTQRIKKIVSIHDAWEVINELALINQTEVQSLPTFEAFTHEFPQIHESAGGIRYVIIDGTSTRKSVHKKLQQIFEEQISSCNTKHEAVETFYSFPVLKGELSTMSERINDINAQWPIQ